MTDACFQRARSPEQREMRRAEILAAAGALLETHPPAEVSLRELSRRVGLSKSNVVRYFPTREAVFLAVLADDWTGWLDALEPALPAPDRERNQHQRVAAAVAGTLAEHRRFCDLLAACQIVLEHNIPIETAREFKAAAAVHLGRLAALVRGCVPDLGENEAVEFASMVWVLMAGLWPMAHPNPVVAAVLAEPEFASMCVEFAPTLTRALTIALDGMTRPG